MAPPGECTRWASDDRDLLSFRRDILEPGSVLNTIYRKTDTHFTLCLLSIYDNHAMVLCAICHVGAGYVVCGLWSMVDVMCGLWRRVDMWCGL